MERKRKPIWQKRRCKKKEQKNSNRIVEMPITRLVGADPPPKKKTMPPIPPPRLRQLMGYNNT